MSKPESVKESKFFRARIEKQFIERMESKGFRVERSSLPGFVCYRQDDVVIFVAVKLSKRHKLSAKQRVFLNTIRRIANGTKIYCYKWSPDDDWTSREDLTLRNDTKDLIPRKYRPGLFS
jgi:D-mannonate dehydratase